MKNFSAEFVAKKSMNYYESLSLEALVDNTEESILEFPLDISKHLYDDIFGAQNA